MSRPAQKKPASNRSGFTSKEKGVYFRDDGTPRWIVRFRYNGQTYREQVHYPVDLLITDRSHPLNVRKAQEDAEELARRERRAWLEKGKPLHQLGKAWTLGSLMERALKEMEEGTIAHASVRTDKSNLNVWLGVASTGKNRSGFPTLTERIVEDLTYDDFFSQSNKKAFNHLYVGKDSSMLKMLKTAQMVFRIAQDKWAIELTNPLRSITGVKIDDGRERILSNEEWEQITEALKGASQATQDAIAFARFTAVRRGEAVKLDWPDVNWTDETAKLRGTKSADSSYRERDIPLPEKALAILKRRFKESKDPRGPVFAHESFETVEGKRVPMWRRIGLDTTTQAWDRARRRVAQSNDDPTILSARAHDLRHTRITELGSVLTIAETAKVSGHKDLKMFMRYFNPRAKDIAKKLNELEKGSPKEKGDLASAVNALVALGDKDSMHIALGMALQKHMTA